MIRYVEVKDFCEQSNDIKLSFEDKLTILTGDNGAGKTSLLNLIFNVINGEFSNLFNSEFSSIAIELESPLNIKEKKAVNSIFVSKNNGLIMVKYFLRKTHYIIKIKKHKVSFLDITYELVSSKEIEGDGLPKSLRDYLSESVCKSLESLIESYPKLDFINLIKRGLIYFPTYRRIDTDILELIEQNYEFNYDIDFEEIRKKIDQSPNINRVIGVGEEDIEILFKKYSDESRKLNSDGLDKLLKKFVENLIKGATSDSLKQPKINNNLSMYDRAPEQLIDLSNNLGIENIAEDKIKEYFVSQREAILEVSDSEKLEITISVKNKETNEEKGTQLEEKMKNLFISAMASSSQNNNLIMKLIELYDRHMKELSFQTQYYEHLKKSFKIFFKDKIEITFDQYNLQLSKPFNKLSTGEKQLITILAFTVLSIKDSVYRPLIIIDEPELSLHISWQLKLIKNLLDISSAHFLLATHSPYIANSSYDKYTWQLGDIEDGY